MIEQITLEEVLKLVTFENAEGEWFVQNVGDVLGIVLGNVGSVHGNVGTFWGAVMGKDGYKTS